MKSYNEFRDELKKAIEEKFANVKVLERKVLKNNVALDAFVIDNGSGICPNFYTKELYESYEKAENFEVYVSSFLSVVGKALYNKNVSFDLSEMKDYEKIKAKLFVSLISRSGNEEYLSDMAHTDFLDLAIMYRIFVETEEDDSLASFAVSNRYLDMWGISLEQLDHDARENAAKTRPAEIKSMTDMLVAIEAHRLGIPEEQVRKEYFPEDMFLNPLPMYVASTPDGLQGAAVLTYPGFFEDACQRLGWDSFYVLPSSISEVILVPHDTEQSEEYLQQMVQDVNCTHVAPEERLSDSLYLYDGKEKAFILVSPKNSGKTGSEASA